MTSRRSSCRASFLARAAGFAAMSASLGGCGKATGERSASTLKLAMVTDVGGLGDKALNDSAYAGLLAAKARLGADIAVVESKSVADFEPNLTLLADEDNDEIYAIGLSMDRDLTRVARNYPRRRFAIVDAVVDVPNVTSITFREEQGAFLAGAAAALVTASKRIGFLGGLDTPLVRRFETGYRAGAREVDPRVEVLVRYLDSFDDAEAGRTLASGLFNAHADVVFVAAGKAGLGAFDAVRSRARGFVIGNDGDQDGLAPGKVLTSVLKRVDVAVFQLAEEARGDKLPSGVLTFGLAEHGVGLTDFTYTKHAIGAAGLARIARLREAIVTGTIVPPTTREALAAFVPVRVR